MIEQLEEKVIALRDQELETAREVVWRGDMASYMYQTAKVSAYNKVLALIGEEAA